MSKEILNSGAKKIGDHWFIGETELIYPVAVSNEPHKIRENLELFTRISERFKLPPIRIFVSDVTALIYMSWLDLETIASDFQDPHIKQYYGTWSEILVAEFESIMRENWRYPGSFERAPGWSRWSRA